MTASMFVQQYDDVCVFTLGRMTSSLFISMMMFSLWVG